VEKISPPLRIALAAVVLLAVVWFVALRPKAPAEEPPLPAAPGVAGLTSDVQKARDAKEAADAAAAAAQKAAGGEGEAAAATNGTDKAAAATNGTEKAAAATNGTEKAAAVQTPAGTAVAVEKPAAPKPAAAAKPKAPADPAAPLVAALRQGRVVILVFRNASSDSEAVAAAVRRVPKGTRATPSGTKPAVVRVVPITQVGRYSTFTEKTQISQAPTTLIIGPKRNAKVIVGYTTAPEVAEAVRDLRAAKR
jgi:hypothetical protein